MKKTSALFVAAALSVVGGLSLAQENMGHSGASHAGTGASGAMSGFTAAMDAMMRDMPTESSGMVDADFLLMMIPHHQSAIDMARVELEQGQDETTKAMAQKVIDAQEAEITEMRAMLEAMGVEPPAATTE